MKHSVLWFAVAIGAAAMGTSACAGDDPAPDAGMQPQPDATVRQDGAGIDSTIVETRDEEVIAETAEGSFTNLVVHDETMFWYGRETADDTSMAIVTRPIGGGAPETLLGGLTYDLSTRPALQADVDSIYFTETSSGTPLPARIARVNPGAPVVPFNVGAGDSVTAMAAGDEAYVWVGSTGSNARSGVFRARRNGAPSVLLVEREVGERDRVLSDGANGYYLGEGLLLRIRLDIATSSTSTLAQVMVPAERLIALSANDVYFVGLTVDEAVQIRKVPKTGGAETILVTLDELLEPGAFDQITALAIDETTTPPTVYFATDTRIETAIYSLVDEFPAVTARFIGTGIAFTPVIDIYADATHLYWATASRISRTEK